MTLISLPNRNQPIRANNTMPDDNCILCGASNVTPLGYELPCSVTSDGYFVETPISHSLCATCGYIFVPDRFRLDVSKFYEEDYNFLLNSIGEEPMMPTKTITYSENLMRQLSPYLAKRPDGSLLDIGAGKGNFVAGVHQHFPNLRISAIEPSGSYEWLQQNEFLVDCQRGFYTSTHYAGHSFDFVSLIGVLEHVCDPADFLRDIHPIMNDESVLLIEVPNFLMNDADLLIVDHLSKFTPNSIMNLFATTGFDVVYADHESGRVPMQFIVRLGKGSTSLPYNGESSVAEADAKLNYLNASLDECAALGEQSLAFYGQNGFLTYLTGSRTVDLEQVVCVIDDNMLYQDTRWQDKLPIVSFAAFEAMAVDVPIFLSMSSCYHERVLTKLAGRQVLGVRKQQ